MKREIGNATLYLGDCVTILPEIGQADAVITDPPYGNDTPYASYVDTQDNLRELISSFLPIARAAAMRCLVTCGVGNMYLYPQPDWILNWTDPSGQGACKWGFPSWQPILAYGKDPFLSAGMGRRSDTIVKRFLRDPLELEHPCPKPVGLMEWLIGRATFPTEVVFDPFMGSGTTGVAAVKTNRKFVGIELDPKYFQISCERIENAQRQERLFA
jgi:DNA modification methylase